MNNIEQTKEQKMNLEKWHLFVVNMKFLFLLMGINMKLN